MKLVSARSGWAMLAAGILVCSAAGLARAELSRKVQAEFRGKILITEAPLDLEEGQPSKIIADCKKRTLLSVKHTMVDGTPTWSFYYTAFMKQKPKLKELSLDFYTTDAEKLYVANKKLTGVDPYLTTLQGKVSISEDDNLLKGRTYLVKLTGQRGKREVVFATATLATK